MRGGAVAGWNTPAMPGWVVLALVALVAVASAAVVRIRVRSTIAGTAWTDSAILLCIVTLPGGLVAAVVFAGVLLGKLLSGVTPYKSIFNASKDALSATAGVAVALPFALTHEVALDNPFALVLVAATITAVEFAIGAPVLALASGMPWWRLHRDDADIKAAFFVGKLLVSVATLALIRNDLRAVLVIPPIALCLHLLFASEVRVRADRNAQRLLAETAEGLAGGDVRTVLATAAGDAVRLFNAEEAEVFLPDGPDGPVLARGDATGQVWLGEPGSAPPLNPWPPRSRTFAAPLTVGGQPGGEVRLRYGGPVSLSPRELLTLRTFASAVRTAAHDARVSTLAERRDADLLRVDPLTGLANRKRFEELTEAALTEPGLTAVLVIELGSFSDVTTAFGFRAADRLLAEVGERLARAAAPGEWVARLDGDEFAVLLANAGSTPAAWERALELVMGLDAPVELPGEPAVRVPVAACAGLAVATSPSVLVPGARAGLDAVAELLRRADVARQQARRTGPRVVRYTPQHDSTDVATLTLAAELARALDQGEIVVRVQPIVDLASGLLIGVEALARWHHPDLGELDPHRFLAAVERAELVAGFDRAVLDQALGAQARLRAVNLSVPVAINVTARSLLDPRFAETVHACLRRHRASAADLVVELTESITLAEIAQVEHVLTRLQADGVRLALDDFGTHSSALALVTRLPFVDLKIDRSFVAGMLDRPEALAVVRSTVDIGRSLDRTVVAEGIEREEQRRKLHDLGCRVGQGHLFGKPVFIDELLSMVKPGPDGVAGRLAAPLSGDAH